MRKSLLKHTTRIHTQGNNVKVEFLPSLLNLDRFA